MRRNKNDSRGIVFPAEYDLGRPFGIYVVSSQVHMFFFDISPKYRQLRLNLDVLLCWVTFWVKVEDDHEQGI